MIIFIIVVVIFYIINVMCFAMTSVDGKKRTWGEYFLLVCPFGYVIAMIWESIIGIFK